MAHDLNPNNVHINGLFFTKPKKLYFGGIFEHYP